MIHHPKNEILELFTTGKLLNPLALMVTAHLNLCKQCSTIYQNLLKIKSANLETSHLQQTDIELDLAFSSVLKMINTDSEISNVKAQTKETVIDISGQSISLPSSFNFLQNYQINWKEFGNKNAIAPLTISPEGNFYLIYIGPGESVPEHDHSGAEYSYVAAGSYFDGNSNFSTGDFSVSFQNHRHNPKATSDDGCLVISWVEGRLNYFKGIFKPLNTILWWYLHRA